MTENGERLMLEHLQRFQASLDRVEARLDEIAPRMINLEHSFASVAQHLKRHAATRAAQLVALKDISRRLERIERRLELTN